MHIERLQVEEGFLDGLDVALVPGLNVIIGARGTGKTSLIELIRFVLDVKSYTPDTTKRSREHALSVLGSGQVTLTLSDGTRKVVVTRTAADATPRSSGPFIPPIMFSQTEIETVGLQASGRLRLLDSFAGSRRQAEAEEIESAAEVRSTTTEAEALRREIDSFTKQLAEIPAIDTQLSALAPSEQQLSKVSSDAAAKKKQLDQLSSVIATSSVSASALDRFKQFLMKFRASLTATLNSTPPTETWPKQAGADPLQNVRARVQTAQRHLQSALHELSLAEREAAELALSSGEQKVQLEEQARQARKEMELLQAGAGTVVRQLQQLRERKAQLESLKALLADREKKLKSLYEKRGRALDRLEHLREQRFAKRSDAASNLNNILGPRIRIAASREGQSESFSAAIAELLKGSGLRYNDLSSALANNMSPRELLEATDAFDFGLVSEVTGISKDRAARLLGILRDADLGAIATAPIEDIVEFQLLDGSDYKDITELSTGQRCTVVLPLILRHTDRILIVDQPEDHIDNAFIAETLIRSLQAREAKSQMIFSTHNANIPVLGGADRVLQLGSDGRRGFVLTADVLDSPAVVNAISTVMEGGADAFSRRASFYMRHRKQ